MTLNDVVLDWFCLINTRGVGLKTFWALLSTYETASEALKHVENPFSKLEAEKRLKRMDCEVILANDKIFPKSLKRSKFCPPMLFCKGDKNVLFRRMLAIIGARNASINGQKIARNLAHNLADKFAIVSGLAKGIDTNAHIGSLDGKQSAVAIVPFGFDNIYPKENQKLFGEIAEKGLVLSEVPYGKAVDQGMFQARNRIISLISEGMIVIEAAYKSGTIATATMALDFGCEVMVVPGTPTDPRNLGSNSLIKNGSNLIQNHFDVLEIMNTAEEMQAISHQKALLSLGDEPEPGNKKDELLALLSDTPISLDELALYLHLDVCKLTCLVSELEIAGNICRNSNNKIILNQS